MRTKRLFGIQFAEKTYYKTTLLDNFAEWKRAKQHFLAAEANKHEVIKRIVNKYCENSSSDRCSDDEIADELRKSLVEVVEADGWQGLFDEFLGDQQLRPDQNGGPLVYRREIKSLFVESDCFHFYFTETALKECNKFKIGNVLNLELLAPTADCKRQFNFGDQFIRYQKSGTKIVALAAAFTPRQEANYLQHTFFHFDLENKIESPKLPIDHQAVLLKWRTNIDLGRSAFDFDKSSHELLFKMIAFLDLAEAEQIYLPPGGKNGTASSENYLKNQQEFPITIVTANWNRWIHIGTKEVTGHWKNVVCGQGGKLRVKRFIESYSRKGISLKPQKLLAIA